MEKITTAEVDCSNRPERLNPMAPKIIIIHPIPNWVIKMLRRCDSLNRAYINEGSESDSK